jgi:hypothetical protein
VAKYFAERIEHCLTFKNKSPRKESHQEKKPEKNNHRMGKTSIPEKLTGV